MKRMLSRSWFLGFPCLLLWIGVAHSTPCQNNLPESNPDSVYIDHGDGTVTDTRTGLMWKQCAEGLSGATCQTGSAQTFPSWAEALAHAEVSTFANHTDWRLPNVKELSSLVEDCRAPPTINMNRFPNTPSSFFWSASPYVGSSVDYTQNFIDAWVLTFLDGSAGNALRIGMAFGVRLVRGGQ